MYDNKSTTTLACLSFEDASVNFRKSCSWNVTWNSLLHGLQSGVVSTVISSDKLCYFEILRWIQIQQCSEKYSVNIKVPKEIDVWLIIKFINFILSGM
jgi:hypothetical protein